MGDNESSGEESRKQDCPSAPIIQKSETQTSAATQNSGDKNPKPSNDNFDRDLVRWTRVVGVFTGFLFVTAVLQFCAMRGQQNIMQGQLDAMEADQRPWIGGPSEIKPRISNDGKTVAFIQIFKNVGRTPTKGFHIDGKIISGSDPEWLSDVRTMCKTATDAVIKNDPISGFTSVPGSDWTLDIAEMPSSKNKIFKIEELARLPNPIIIGCVLYGSPLDRTRIIHKSGYVSKIDISGHAVNIAFVYTVDAD